MYIVLYEAPEREPVAWGPFPDKPSADSYAQAKAEKWAEAHKDSHYREDSFDEAFDDYMDRITRLEVTFEDV